MTRARALIYQTPVTTSHAYRQLDCACYGGPVGYAGARHLALRMASFGECSKWLISGSMPGSISNICHRHFASDPRPKVDLCHPCSEHGKGTFPILALSFLAGWGVQGLMMIRLRTSFCGSTSLLSQSRIATISSSVWIGSLGTTQRCLCLWSWYEVTSQGALAACNLASA